MTPLYLDHQATTPCDPRVLDAMLPWFTEAFGNPHSTEHEPGRRAADAVEQARAEVAALIGAEPAEIVFTSGATEANNLAIKGAARFAARFSPPGTRRRLVTFATEHRCVLDSMADLAAEGFAPIVLPLHADGSADMPAFAAALATPTLLVSAMAANNETGLLHDLPALAATAHDAGALLHSDLAQAAGKTPIDVRAIGLDLGSLSAHKLYGPKGIGALFVRRRPRVRLAPLFSGGGQERGLRSGTVPVPLAVGFGAACRIARAERETEQARLAALGARLLAALRARVPGLALNGAATPRLAGSLNIRVPGLRALDLIRACPELALSTGSACSSAELAPSHVLTALGLDRTEAASSLRIGLGRFTSAADIDRAATILAGAIHHLRQTEAETLPCPA